MKIISKEEKDRDKSKENISWYNTENYEGVVQKKETT